MGMSRNPDSGWQTMGRLAKALLWFIYAWLIINLVLLLLAFTLRLFGANPSASFVDWVYDSVTGRWRRSVACSSRFPSATSPFSTRRCSSP
jgi:hypothetical protein